MVAARAYSNANMFLASNDLTFSNGQFVSSTATAEFNKETTARVRSFFILLLLGQKQPFRSIE